MVKSNFVELIKSIIGIESTMEYLYDKHKPRHIQLCSEKSVFSLFTTLFRQWNKHMRQIAFITTKLMQFISCGYLMNRERSK